jgi:multiple sugar transport system permease protein
MSGPQTIPTVSTARRPRVGLARRVDRLSDRQFAALISLPGAVLIVIALVPPILAVVTMSLYRIDILKPGPSYFTGLDNYRSALDDADFTATIPRTITFALASTALAVPAALLLATVLNRRFRGVSALTVLVLLPWAIAPVVTGIYWQFIFSASFGLATGVANWLGLANGSVAWLQNPTAAMTIAIVANAWRSVPLLTIILLAALKAIPPRIYQAAIMDGATPWQAFRHVTAPLLSGALLVVALLQLITSLQVFDIIFSLTGGGPGDETQVASYYIYLQAFSDLSFGYSAALALVLLGMIAAASSVLVYVRVRRHTVGVGT